MKLNIQIIFLLVGGIQLFYSQNIGSDYGKVNDMRGEYTYFYDFLVFKNNFEGSFLKFTHQGKKEDNFQYRSVNNDLFLDFNHKNSRNLVVDKDLLIDNEQKLIYVDIKKYGNSNRYIFKNNSLEKLDSKMFKEISQNQKLKFVVGFNAYKKYGYDYVLGVLEID